MIRKLFGHIRCLIGDHEWTSAAMQNVKPTDLTMAGFKEYSRMYCKYCGKNSPLNDRL